MRYAFPMQPPTSPPDAAAYFGSENEIVDYLDAWLKDGSPREIARALGDVARAKGVAHLSLNGRAGRQELHPALSRDGNPRLDLVMALLNALRLELTVRKRAA